jgi:predicted TIM-barrel fold metal-dependent hydrolase
MDKCFGDWGFVQLGEMLQYMLDFDMAGPGSVAVTRRAAEFGVPVQCHVSTMTDQCVAHFAGVRDLARQVPEAQIILAHALGGANTQYYIEEFERSGMDPDRTWFEFRDFHNIPANRLALERLRPDRMIPGTDWVTRVGPPYLPYGTVFNYTADTNPYPPSAEALMGFLREAGATDEQVRRLGSDNPRELLGWRLAQYVKA